MSQFLILMFDLPAFMAEETVRAARTVPRAIVLSFTGGCLLNLGLLITFLYCVVNVDHVVTNGSGITGSACDIPYFP